MVLVAPVDIAYGPSLSRLSAADPAIYQGTNIERILSQWQPLNPDQVAARMRWRDRRLAALKAQASPDTLGLARIMH